MDNEQKHTPGPFKVIEQDIYATCPDENHIFAIASVYWGSHISKEIMQANARLLATADELLEACEFAKSQIKKQSPKKALPVLRAAIAKATKEP